MPLRAKIGGQEIIAPLLSEAEWEALRERVSAENLRVVLPCCDVEGYLRRSKFGTQHFAHKQASNDCQVKSETVEHLRAKADIVLACQAAGYHASTEVAGDDWRADVLASRGAARIAFEVQWSFLRLNDALFRQRRYERDGVRGCWFFRRPPAPLHRGDADTGPELAARRDLPLFHLFVNADGSFNIALNSRLYRLGEFVAALLGGRIRFCEVARGKGQLRLRAVFFEMDCLRCGRRSHLYYVDTAQTASCGLHFRPELDWYSDEYAFNPAMLSALRQYRESDEGHHLRMGAIRRRTDARGETYTSFGCHACDAMFDRETVHLALYGAERSLTQPGASGFEANIILRQPATGQTPHWCYPADGRFCCD